MSEEHTVSSQVRQPLDTKEVWIVANGGYDYLNLELLQICSAEEIAKQFLTEYNAAHPKPFPWNQRGYVKIELDKPFRLPDEPAQE